MATTLNEKMRRLAPDRRERVESETERLHQEYLTLQQLRKAKEITQAQLAETLGVGQATIAKMERRSDLMISTLRRCIEAMGGRLELTVEFPDHEVIHLEGLGDVEGAPTLRKAAP
ncbi:MAG: XRE family transcriptional regulator [Chloroflexi bacterium]|nr:XRE family transcriptional regulator [Chloroflexota bacterium]